MIQDFIFRGKQLLLHIVAAVIPRAEYFIFNWKCIRQSGRNEIEMG